VDVIICLSIKDATKAGQAAAETTTSNPREPAATDEAQRQERRAKVERPEPNRPEATGNTSKYVCVSIFSEVYTASL